MERSLGRAGKLQRHVPTKNIFYIWFVSWDRMVRHFFGVSTRGPDPYLSRIGWWRGGHKWFFGTQNSGWNASFNQISGSKHNGMLVYCIFITWQVIMIQKKIIQDETLRCVILQRTRTIVGPCYQMTRFQEMWSGQQRVVAKYESKSVDSYSHVEIYIMGKSHVSFACGAPMPCRAGSSTRLL